MPDRVGQALGHDEVDGGLQRLAVDKKYPVIDYIYPGPQGGSVGNWSFTVSRVDCQALAELGFVVVEIEGTSNPYRSKKSATSGPTIAPAESSD